jgi:hypothetical protein
MQDAVAFSIVYKKKLRQHNFPFKSRVGIHWDEMFIVETPAYLIAANHKRISLDGIGKNIAARAMSLCGPEQILLTHEAYLSYKNRVSPHPYISKNTLVVCVGLYKFKGVANPEQLWAVGNQADQLQPPPSNNKVKRIAGPKRIRIRLKHKKIKELAMETLWYAGILSLAYLLYVSWPLLSSAQKKKSWNIDFLIFKPFEHIQAFFDLLQGILL